MNATVGMIGLGIMGSAISTNLLAAGFEVVGRDIDSDRQDAFVTKGGMAAPTPRAVAEATDLILLSLPSISAFEDVVMAEDGLASARRDGLVVVEMSTLPIGVKERGRDALAFVGTTLLDCPLSGTGTQAVNKDLVVYASGDPAAIERCPQVFDGFARSHFNLGEFGNGSRMKFVANLLVAVHNVAAAEAFVLGMKAGSTPRRFTR